MTHEQAADVVNAAGEGPVSQYLTVTTVGNLCTSTVCITDRRVSRQARYVDYTAAIAHVREAAEAVQRDVLAQARDIVQRAEEHYREDTGSS